MCDHDTDVQTSLLLDPIWYNDKIKLNGKSVYWKTWYQNGIHIINDMIKDWSNLIFYTLDDIHSRYNFKPNFLEYHGIMAAIKRYIFAQDDRNRNREIIIKYPYIPQQLRIFFKSKKGIKDFYNILNFSNLIPNGKNKWNRLFTINETSWKQIYQLPFQITSHSKLQ